MDEGGRRAGIALIRRLSAVATRIHAGDRLQVTLQAIADTVVDELGFGVAAVNNARADGSFEMVAVAGSQECADALLGKIVSAQDMDAVLADGQAWGQLRYVSHTVAAARTRPHSWKPSFTPIDAPDAWHPEDSLFAPLRSTSGELLGILSVDLPADGRRPGSLQRELLEVLAVQAGLAISATRLQDELRREHDYLLAEQSRLRASEEAFRFAFSDSSIGMAMIGLVGHERGRYLRVNPALARLLGASVDEVLGSSIGRFAIDQSAAGVERALATAIEQGTGTQRADRRCRHADGSEIWLSLRSSIVGGGGSQRAFLLVQAEDAAARLAREQQLVHEAEHDALTALPNRRLVLQRLDAALTFAREAGVRTTVLFCDLDDFKNVNDTYGHLAGDAVLAEIASRLRAAVRAGDVAGRLGGDEFVVLATDLDDEQAAALVARIRAVVAEPLDHAPGMTVGVSIGSLTLDADTDQLLDPLGVLQRVDAAMYSDKARLS